MTLAYCIVTNAKSDVSGVRVVCWRVFYITSIYQSQTNFGKHDPEPVQQCMCCPTAASASKPIRNAESQAPPQTFWFRTCILTRPLVIWVCQVWECSSRRLRRRQSSVSKSNWNQLCDSRPLNLSELHFLHLKNEGLGFRTFHDLFQLQNTMILLL